MLYDISRTLSPDIAVWPGDTPYSSKLVMALAEGGSVNVTTLTLSAHTGTHTDAPYHFSADGQRIGDVPLEPYLGPARVISVDKLGGLLPADLDGHDLTGVERLLFHTPASDLSDDAWPEHIAHMTPDMAAFLAERGVKLVGLDSPSMDALDSKELEAHNAMRRLGITILEGLLLRDVPDGDYELIALPLKLADSDASPVRAILRQI